MCKQPGSGLCGSGLDRRADQEGVRAFGGVTGDGVEAGLAAGERVFGRLAQQILALVGGETGGRAMPWYEFAVDLRPW